MASENSSSNDPEKHQVTLSEDARHHPSTDPTFEVDEAALPPGYFKTSFFWGSMTAIGLGLYAGVSGFAYAAPILGVINADIGPVRT